MSARPRGSRREFRKGDNLDIDDPEELPFNHVRLLGHGHSGTVEEVRDENTGAVFARKTITIPTSKRARAERSDTFSNEVRTIRKLSQHHHVIEVFATYITEEYFGLILQPVADEGDLSKFLKRFWKFLHLQKCSSEYDRRLTHMGGILKQAFGCLASGLVFMHKAGIRHKDIKPHNILIHKGSVIYTDFGYSLDTSLFSQSISDGKGLLTRMYSAPEGLDREGRNQFSDIFSLGCVFLELLSALYDEPGLCPEGADLTSQKDRIFAASMYEIHACLAKLPLSKDMAFLSKVIVSMTRASRADRPSAQEVLCEIVSKSKLSCAQCCPQEGFTLQSIRPWQWCDFCKDYVIKSGDEREHSHYEWMSNPSTASCQGSIGKAINKQLTVQTAMLQVPDNACTVGGAQSSDSDFRSRDGTEARTFWVLGRVFRMRQWEIEPQTQASNDIAPDAQALEGKAPTETSSFHTSKETVRRREQCFVVVNVNRTYVQTCLITTYHKKGTTDPSCDPSKHTVVHTAGVDPESCFLEGERERGLIKHPIEVAPSERGTKLPRQSRIRLFSTVTVNFGDSVKDVGLVIPEHRELLCQYWSEEAEDLEDGN